MTKFIERRTNSRESQKDIIIFYHADCTDGFTAAWAAWKKFGDSAEYVAQFHEDPPPPLSGKQIYTLDMTFSEEATRRLMQENQVTSIDHHVSASVVTQMTQRSLYDINHSGCVLAWHYFHPDKAVPEFLLNVEDVDLWKNEKPYGPILYSYLDLFDFSFEIWDRVITDFENHHGREKIIEQGELLYKYEEKEIMRTINKYAKLVEFEGYKVYAVNTTQSASATAAKLYEMHPPFAIVWKENKDGLVLVSIRGNGEVDLSKIAVKYGGGGHKNSVGFRLSSLTAIPWKGVAPD